MKIPKSVIIAGRCYKVIRDKSISGAEWHSDPGVIKIGHHQSDEELTQWLIHECIEAILVMRNHGYENAESRMFVFNHSEFSNIINDVYLALKPMLKS
jgi:hypothetical protein